MSEYSIKDRRAELLVEGFLDELGPSRFVHVETDKLDFDFVVAFKKPHGELKYCAIETKQSDKPISGDFHFITGRRFLEASRSNMPTVILVADTKQNQLYYGFAFQAKIVNEARKAGSFEVALPVKKTGHSPAEKRQFIEDVLRTE